MTIVDVLILGVIEGITEFLPVSSTAHLLIAERLLNLTTSTFLTSFTIVIQMGAIAAVAVLFAQELLTNRDLAVKTLIAFVPTAILGFTLYRAVKEILLTHLILIPISLIVGGILFILLDPPSKESQIDKITETPTLSYAQAFYLGLYQTLSFVPGVSRSGAVIIGGLLMKIKRPELVKFTFWLALPTMAAASAYDLLKSGSSFSGSNWEMIFLGLGVSFIVSLCSIRWLLGYIKTHTFAIFGWYRIIAGTVILLILLV